MALKEFWQGRRVLLTGHTGFKGAWAALWLSELGAEVHGFALPPETSPSLWREAGQCLLASEGLADLGDRAALSRTIAVARPHVVLHFAAQALVRRSYADPVATIATNALGTVHLLDALRDSRDLQAVLVVTTDKVYQNSETGRDFVESDQLGGHDPYSASKAAAEILVRSYADSFFDPAGVPVATARAGNVIGGGDWSADRLVPDVWHAFQAGEPLMLRNPKATRPWQHVLEPLAGYFLYVQRLATDPAIPRALNFGPVPGQGMSVSEVAEVMSSALGAAHSWKKDLGEHPKEMRLLSLDPTLARESLGWEPRLGGRETMDWTARWYAEYGRGADPRALCLAQIRAYQEML